MKASELMVKALENEGVEYIFGVPGEENLDFVQALSQSTIQLIITRHEQAAAFMAATFGRLTAKPGVCLSTLGPGATNLVTGVAYGLLGGMPMVILTGQKPITKSKQARFQIIDVVHMMQPITKMTKQIVDANNIPSLIRESFRIAQFEKPGPVHLELPEDIAEEQVDRRPFPVTIPATPAASNDSIVRAAGIISQAKKPLVVLAAGANRRDTPHAIQTFIEKTGIYFLTTQMGKGIVDENNPRCLGTAALSDGDYVHTAIDEADLIINIGHDVSEKPPFFMTEGGVDVLHINFSPAEMDDVYFPQYELVGCISTNISLLATALEDAGEWPVSAYAEIEARIQKDIFSQTDFPFASPQYIVSQVRQAVDKKGIISLDNGFYKIWFSRNYVAYEPNSVLLDNALASMGAGLPAAMAAKMVHPDRTVVAVCGDGGFMMNSQELETAMRLQLNLVILVLRDNAYGMIKWKQADMAFEDFGLDFGNPDFVQYANSYGAEGYRVQQDESLSEVIQRCIAKGGVQLIEMPVDYYACDKTLPSNLIEKMLPQH